MFTLWFAGYNATVAGGQAHGPLRHLEPGLDFDKDSVNYNNNKTYHSKAKFVMAALTDAAVKSGAVQTAAALHSLDITSLQSVALAAIAW